MKMHRGQRKTGSTPSLFITVAKRDRYPVGNRGNSKKKWEKRRWAVTLFRLLSLMLPAFTSAQAEPTEVRRLVLGYSATSFYDVDVKDATAAMTVWSREIGRENGTKVESIIFKEPKALLAHYQAGGIDFAVMRTEEYLRAVKTADFTTAVTVVYGGKKTQRLLLIVHAESPFQSIKDLRNKTLALYKGDTLGPLYLSNLLMKEKLPEIPKNFSLVSEKGMAPQTVLSVFFRQSDACVINERTFDMAAELNPQLKRKLRIIGISPEFVLGLGVIRNDLAEDQREDLKKVLLTLGDTPRGKQIIAVFKSDRFVLIQPADLDSVRKLLQENDQGKTRQ